MMICRSALGLCVIYRRFCAAGNVLSIGKDVKLVVSSLRVDAVAAAGLRISRKSESIIYDLYMYNIYLTIHIYISLWI